MSTKKYVCLIFSALAVAGLSACSASMDKEAMKKVKTIAVVGYTMDYNMSTSEGMKSGLMGNEEKMGMSKIQNRIVGDKVSDRSYDYLVKKLQNTGWTVISPKKTMTNPHLKKFFEQKVHVGYLPLQSQHERYQKTGIPQYHYISGQKSEQWIKDMAKELKVDAIAFAYADTNIGNPLAIIGSTKYSAKIMLDIYHPKMDKFIARLSTTGEEVKEVKDKKDFKNMTRFNTYLGFQKAADKLVETIKTTIQ